MLGDDAGSSAAHAGPFFRAVENVGSAFERSRVLQAVIKRPDVPDDVLVGVLHALTT